MNRFKKFIFNFFKEEFNNYLKENIMESSKEYFKEFSKDEIKELLIEIGQERFQDKIRLNQFIIEKTPKEDTDTFEKLVPFFKYKLIKINFDYELVFEDGITKTISKEFKAWGELVKYCNGVITKKEEIYSGEYEPISFKSPALKIWFEFDSERKIENWKFGNGFSPKEYSLNSLKNICFEIIKKLEDYPELMI